MRNEEFEFGGYKGYVVIPDNPNGKWIWKTEFFHAFEASEVALFELGYTRVYYKISDMYGSSYAVRLMHEFHKYIVEKYSLEPTANLFGFSRGGLYAFNYALFYPECVRTVYLDAPVMDLSSWPKKDTVEQKQFFEIYNVTADTLASFKDSPVHHIPEYTAHGIPTLLVVGGVDESVPYEENSKALVDWCEKNSLPLDFHYKPECGHHPHSLEDVSPIVEFIEKHNA